MHDMRIFPWLTEVKIFEKGKIHFFHGRRTHVGLFFERDLQFSVYLVQHVCVYSRAVDILLTSCLRVVTIRDRPVRVVREYLFVRISNSSILLCGFIMIGCLMVTCSSLSWKSEL